MALYKPFFVYTAGWFDVAQENITIPLTTTPSMYIQPSSELTVKVGLFGDYSEVSYMPNGWMNKCSSNYNNERRLHDSVATEAINKHGVCMSYYVTTYDVGYDRIFGEDNNRRFVRKFPFMTYYTLPKEDKLWSKFGIEGMDSFSMYATKLHFKEASRYDNDGNVVYASYRPKQGDIIMSEYNTYIYEVVEVKEEAVLFELSKGHYWELIVRPYRDEHMTLSSETSGTYIKDYVSKEDIFNVAQYVTSAASAIKYSPSSTDQNVDPFGKWD